MSRREKNEFKEDVELKTRARRKTPDMYKVIIHNDDYTTMDFVVEILIRFFHKPAAEATQIMLQVHRRGHGVAGVFTYDIAVTKVNEVHEAARQAEFPLKCSVEKA
ncbi:MAG: ATP-dependent Clp protease adapter ClpS [Acidobacteria bacterium]|nr:ATP-dependent Clp protease adapter ClpS [Acidobacteriota bacterium]